MSETAIQDRAQLADLSREEKLALLTRLAREKQAAAARPDFSGGRDPYPLTFAQQRLLFLHHLEGGTNVHTQFRAMWLTGPLDRGALDAALVEIVRRHEALRTRFVIPAGAADSGMEGARQVIDPAPKTVLRFVDLTSLPAERRRAAAEGEAAHIAHDPFDLVNGPVLRATLARLGDDEHALMIGLHHIVSDGLSRGLLLAELAALYTAFEADELSTLPPVRAQLGGFALFQRERMRGERLAAELAFWSHRLEGAPARLELPADRPRRGIVTPEGRIETLTLPVEVADGLRALARESGATTFMVMLALYDALLMRYSGKRDLVVGLPVAARDYTELESAIGCFANTFVQRARMVAGGSFRDLLAAVKAEIFAVLPHAEVPFEKVVETVAPERDFAHNPIFQVMFALQEVGEGRFTLPKLEVAPLVVERAMANVDLTMELVDAGGRGEMHGFFDYAVDLFDRATIQRMVGHLACLAESILATPDRPLGRLALLPAAERAEVLAGWASPAWPEPPRPVHLRFAEQARERPDLVALVDGDRILTYGEVDRRANRLARVLRKLGVGPDVTVGICLHRSAELMIAVLAVLKADGAYVPLDPAYPRQRLALMIEDSGVSLVVTAAEAAKRLPKPVRGVAGGARYLQLDRGPYGILREAEAESSEPLVPRGGPESELDQLAYLIYTSGSTGTPKAVAVPHRGVTNHASAFAERLRMEPGKRFLYSASISFDVAAEEIYPVWVSGATLVILPPGPFPSFADLLALIEERRLTGVDLPTPYWHEWVAELARSGGQPPACLDLVLVGTEQASAERLVEWLRLVGERPRWVNAYGPTETTISASAFIPTLADADGLVRVPIGKPIEGVRAFILDEHFEPTPIGVPGELFLAGPGVVRGYLRRAALTAAAFVPHPFASEPGSRLYATGDRARYRLGGNIEFLGRDDDQVKIRGFRIELGEVAEALRAHEAVADCAVLVEQEAGGPRLVAYVVAAPGSGTGSAPGGTASELAAHLGSQLPPYMMPAIVPVADLPLTTAGKIDRKKLAALAIRETETERRSVAPKGPLEEAMAAIWCDVLNTDQVGAEDDFFEIGGHSLLATRILARLRQVLEVELSLPTFFESRTVAGLAAAVAKARLEGSEAPPPIVPVAREGGVICSFAQQRMWFLDQLMPDNPANNIPQLVRFEGAVSVPKLEGALDGLIRRHETMRTTFALASDGPLAGQPVQHIAPPLASGTRAPEARLRVVDLSGLAAAWPQAEALARIDSVRRFDLSRGPLVRAFLLRLAPADHLLYFCTHHIVTDGVSLAITVRELVSLYGAAVRGTPSDLPELAVQYADFAAWQRDWLRGEALERQMSFWRGRLAGAPVAIELPTDRPRPAVETMTGARHYFSLSPGIASGLTVLGRGQGATLFMALAAAFNALLSRYSGQNDVVVGWPISGRYRPEIEPLIGFVSNLLVLRTDLRGEPDLPTLVARVREAALGAYDHQALPFEQLVEELQPERSLAHHPIFQVFFVLHHRAPATPPVSGLAVSMPSFDNHTAQLDLLLSLMETSSGGLWGFLEYKRDLFDSTTIQRMEKHFTALLEAALAAPEVPLARLPLLGSGALHQVVHGWNDTREPLAPATLPALIAARAVADPEHEAVRAGGESLTYGQLTARAEQLARRLVGLGVRPEEPVGVCHGRSVELMVALLGVLQAGGAYLPLDPDFPAPRRAMIARDAGARFALVERGLEPHLEGTGLELLELRTPNEAEAEGPQAPARPLPEVSPNGLAYIIYTSGSTGVPKGVAISHGAVCNLVRAMAEQPGFGPEDTLLGVAPYSFDLSVADFWWPLAAGGTLVLADAATARDGALLGRALDDNGVTLFEATPSTWRQLLSAGWRGRPTLRALSGGEAMSRALADQIRARVGSLVNIYGPTEATVWTAHGPVDDDGPVTLGRPIANSALLVLDRRGSPVPVGVVGELTIAGVGLARGYLGRPALTADRFVPHPYADGARLYRTGDLCRQLADGRIVFLDRGDLQVKVRGYRLELGEVETVLARQPEVVECVVTAHRGTEAGEARLVAYYVPVGGEAAGVRELRKALGRDLPDYMVPSIFVTLAELPRNRNGKVDREALPEPEVTRAALSAGYEPPQGSVEEGLARIWAEVLGVDKVGRHDRFFDLGGHSLMATQVLSRVLKAFDVELPLRAVFEAPTVASFGERLVEAELEAAGDDLLGDLLAELDEPQPRPLASSRKGDVDG